MSLIAFGVCGGIGAYKAVEIARGLQDRGHDVAAILTRSARRFVGRVTFEAITRRRVLTDQFAPGVNAEIEHIRLASDAGLLLVAPATANIIGKFAHGIADDFLSSLYLATRAPVLLAPAMNTNMLEHEAVRHNLALLQSRGVRVVDPDEGYLACGWIGKGRLASVETVVAAVDALLQPPGPLRGRRVLVTAGPTYEDVDPVRYLGNRSSGRMGYALAAEAAARGAHVVLVSGPTTVAPPAGVELVAVRSALEMHASVMHEAAEADVVVMAAAVADYMVEGGGSPQKVTKGAERLTLTLTRTPDILADLGRRRGSSRRPILVGFAAETEDLLARAREKLRAKRADLIVANDVSRPDSGFAADTNAAILVTPEGEEPQPLQPKRTLAAAILDRVERLLAGVRVTTSAD